MICVGFVGTNKLPVGERTECFENFVKLLQVIILGTRKVNLIEDQLMLTVNNLMQMLQTSFLS